MTMRNFIKILGVAMIVALSCAAFGALQGSPFMPEIDSRFNLLEGSVINTPHGAKQVLKATYDFSNATQLGGSTADIDLGVTLPANSLVTRSYIYIVTPLTGVLSVGGTTTKISCTNDSNILVAKDLSQFAAGYMLDGIQTGASLVSIQLSAACNPKVRFGAPLNGGGVSAGKFNLYLEYVPTN